jgi:hypothetical protein
MARANPQFLHELFPVICFNRNGNIGIFRATADGPNRGDRRPVRQRRMLYSRLTDVGTFFEQRLDLGREHVEALYVQRFQPFISRGLKFAQLGTRPPAQPLSAGNYAGVNARSSPKGGRPGPKICTLGQFSCHRMAEVPLQFPENDWRSVMPRDSDPAVQALQGLRTRCKLSKDRHFAAAERKSFYQTWVGLPVVLINVFVGTVLVQFMTSDHPPIWASVIATALAFLAASLSSVQTFFNFAKMAEGHRTVANRYLRTMMQCENLLLRVSADQISQTKVWELIEQFTREYDEVNLEGEAFPTNAWDFKRATKKNSLLPFALAKEAESARENQPGKIGSAAARPERPIEAAAVDQVKDGETSEK